MDGGSSAFGLMLSEADCKDASVALGDEFATAKAESIAFVVGTFGREGRAALVEAASGRYRGRIDEPDPSLMPPARTRVAASKEISDACSALISALRTREAQEHWRDRLRRNGRTLADGGGIVFSVRRPSERQSEILTTVENTLEAPPAGIEALYAELDGLDCRWSDTGSGEVSWSAPEDPLFAPLAKAVTWGDGVWLGEWPDEGSLLWRSESESIFWKPKKRDTAVKTPVANDVLDLLRALTSAYGYLADVLDERGVVKKPKPSDNRAAALPASKRLPAKEQKRLEEIRAGLLRKGIKLGPALTVGAVEEYEARHAVRLPPQYRAFLIQVGNGASGPPAYGLRPLEETPLLGQPFPLREGWTWEGEEDEPEDADEIRERLDHGRLRLGDDGCAQEWILIVSGKARGQVWIHSDVGVTPPEEGTAPSFFDWVERWLNRE